MDPKMDMNGNDRYFKYRYANGTTVNVMTIVNHWLDKKNREQFMFMAEYLERIFNIKVNFIDYKISRKDYLSHFYYEPYFFRKAHIIMYKSISSLFEGRLDHFTPSPPCGTLKTIIVSQPQVAVTSASWSFLNMDKEVGILMALTLVLLSVMLVIHSIVTNKYKSLCTMKALKKVVRKTLENVWENASLLCAEPIPFVLPHITYRLLTLSWLIGVTFILFFLGCFMRTDFTTESYNRIDSLSDLIKSEIPPIMFAGTTDIAYLENLSKHDPVVKEWLNALDRKKMFFGGYSDLFTIDAFIPVLSGKKAMILQETLLPEVMNTFKLEKFLQKKGGLHISRDSVNIDFMHLIFNTTWMRQSPQVQQNVQLSVAPLFEMQVFKYQHFQFHYSMERVTWKRPLKSKNALNLNSVSVPFHILLTLLSATVLVVLTEKIFNYFT